MSVRGRIGSFVVAVSVATAGAEERKAAEREVVPGAQYRAGALHRLLLGHHHRDLWTAKLTAPVLDLDTFGGGLTLLRRGGRGQTKSLRFRGRDGREYTVRSVDKDPQALLSPELKKTFVARVLQDQMSVGHPLGALVAAPLQKAAGVLGVSPVLAVLPDDPRLGEHRAEFAGMFGLIEERPNEGEDGEPLFAGARDVIGSDELLEKLEKDPDDRVDARAYLRARLLDVFLGDWDRHRDQWRWAGYDEGGVRVWRAIPRDRDQAFSRMDGVLLWLAGFSHPELVGFGPEYPALSRLSWSGRVLDRRLLASLEKAAWEEEAAELQRRLTPEVIADAVSRLPAHPLYVKNGRDLAAALRARRERLGEAARDFYGVLAREVEVTATDKKEVAEVAFAGDGSATVSVRTRRGSEPYFRRTFLPGETSEVRLHLRGGDDELHVAGDGGAVVVRVLGGGGDDTYVDASRVRGGLVRLYDDRGHDRFEVTPRTVVDRRPPLPPMAAPTKAKIGMDQGAAPRDWGSRVTPGLPLSFSSDHGLVFGPSATVVRYGFRQAPFRQRHALSAVYASKTEGFRLEYQGELFRLGHRSSVRLQGLASEIELLRFHGLGNETPPPAGGSYTVQEDQLRLEPGLVVPVSPRVELAFGPRLLLTDTHRGPNPLVVPGRTYGAGRFDRAAVWAQGTLDTRDTTRFAAKGHLLTLGGSVTPSLLDARESYGEVHAQAATHVPLGGAVFALRAAGQRVFGRYPFSEAAFLGGTDSLRGFARQRFAGDGAVWGNAELRVPLGRFFLFLPAEGGVFGLADLGRVYLDGEDSDRWHTAVGGGVWISFLDRRNTLTIGAARSKEGTRLFAGAGFAF